MSTMISIDYDFFVPHGMFDDIRLPDGDTMSGMLVFDWQMAEGRNPTMDEFVWRGRVGNFERMGLDIVEMTKPPLSVAEFAKGLWLEDALSAWRADSHAWAAGVARSYEDVDTVYNFDAHHDLGYGEDPLATFRATGNIACDDWALIALDQGWIDRYVVVYPDWLGRKEWLGPDGEEIERPWLEPFKDRITILTWSEFLAGPGIEEPEVAFLCRSSSWVPPWLDAGFVELQEEFSCAECLDCLYGQMNTPYDTCEDRAWDWDEVRKEVEVRTAMIDELMRMRAKGEV